MRWKLAVVIWVAYALTPMPSPVFASATAAEDNLREDARLQKPVTLQLPGVLLSKAMDEIGKQTGVTFAVDTALREEKATLFVSGKPAWQVVSKLATLLGLRCETQGEGYLLTSDPQMRKLERDAVEWERNLLRRKAEATIRSWASFAGEDFPVRLQRATALEEEMERLSLLQPPGWQERRAALAERLSTASQAARFHSYLTGWLYRNTPSSIWRQLWSGEILWFSTEEGVRTLPANALHWWAYPNKLVPQALRFGIRYNEQEEELCFYTLVLPAGESEPPQADVSTENLELDENTLLQNPLHRRWEQWKTPLEALGNHPALQRELQALPPGDGQTTAAELLAWIAKQSGLNVIADAYRYAVPPWTEGNTLAEWLRESPLVARGYLRIEGNWLLYRHGSYWRLRLSEPPEELILQLAEKAKHEGLSLDDYALLATYLPREGKTRLVMGSYVFPFECRPVQYAASALRFWASLTADQKKAALQRQPLLYVSLTPAQQTLFREAMLAKLYEEPKATLFDALNNPALQPDLAFVIDRWREEAYTLSDERISITTESPEELEQQRHLVPNALDGQEQARIEQITFYFGIDSGRSVRYDLSICRNSISSSSAKQKQEEPFSKILSEK